MKKTHFEHGPHGTACGRASTKTTTNVYRVDCLDCKKSDQFNAAETTAEVARAQAFMAQVAKPFMEPWKPGQFIICSNCKGGNFRIGDRTCYGHYENYHCSDCSHVESRLTETGMSF